MDAAQAQQLATLLAAVEQRLTNAVTSLDGADAGPLTIQQVRGLRRQAANVQALARDLGDRVWRLVEEPEARPAGR